MQLSFTAEGLIPAIVQDESTGEVLMMAWMNQRSLQLTLETGKATYWSRSRGELWVKGATSGNYQHVVSLHHDCDADSLLVLVRQDGVACHTGTKTCFTHLVTCVVDQSQELQLGAVAGADKADDTNVVTSDADSSDSTDSSDSRNIGDNTDASDKAGVPNKAEPRSARRGGLGFTVVICLLGGALGWYATGRGWIEITLAQAAPLANIKKTRTGQDIAPWLTACNLAIIAGVLALVATKRLARTAIAGLIAVAGLASLTAGVYYSVLLSYGWWPGVVAVGGALVALGAIKAIVSGRSWWEMGNRKPIQNNSLWDSIDAGDDPTLIADKTQDSDS